MLEAKSSPSDGPAERRALRRRVKQMYGLFNRERWQECFALIDPKLRKASKVEFPVYARGLQAFREVYGAITPWYIRINLHLDPTVNKRDPRPLPMCTRCGKIARVGSICSASAGSRKPAVGSRAWSDLCRFSKLRRTQNEMAHRRAATAPG
jgi:hypothetical protein